MVDGTTQGGSAIVAGDEITTDNGVGVSARQAQRVKIDSKGVDGAFTDASPTNPLPTDERMVGGTAVSAFPAGFARVTDEPHQLFYDPFDAALDTTNRWAAPTSAGGGVAASVTAGVLTLGSGTTINGYSYLTSQATFTPTIPAWLGNSWALQLEAGSPAGTNAVRFWGHGIVSGSVPSSTNPLGTTGNGYGFELDIAGVLQAVVYANGTRTVVSSLSALQTSDGAYHRYICYYRTDRIYWYIDGLSSAQLGATSSFQAPAVQSLPMLALSVAHSAAPVASRALTITGLAVWDTGKNNSTLSDGTFGWRKATVKAASTAAAATDTAMVVALHPSSPSPREQLASTTVVSRSGTITTGGTAQTLAAANTARIGLTLQNTDATTDLWFTEDGATTAALNVGYKLPAGSSAKISTQKSISIWGATTAKTFAATEF